MADKKEVAAAPGTAIASWQEELNQMAVATATVEKPQGNWVSFKGGQLTIGGMRMKDDKAQIVVIHSVFENQLYANKYNPNDQQPPICYAFGESDEDLKPHKESAKPQAESCAVCPNNEWGSDPGGGRGKACKNVRRLAMISRDDATLEKVDKAEVVLAKLPVTSVKNWSTFASQVANVLKVPPIAVIAEMSVTPDAKTQFQVNFDLIDQIKDGALIQKLLTRRRDTNAMVYVPYDKPVERPEQPAQVRKF
jgi:hypothetical protein